MPCITEATIINNDRSLCFQRPYRNPLLPGPIPPVGENDLKKERVVVRNYRNRRIGDFLKELDLTEGRSTGIPKIRTAMIDNGSPEPEFHTDDDRTHFLTIFRANMDAYEGEAETSEVKESGVAIGVAIENLNERQKKAIEYVKVHGSITRNEYEKLFNVSSRTAIRDLNFLVDNSVLEKQGINKNSHYIIIEA